MSETEQVFTQQDIDKALQAVNKVADAVSKSEWNYERLKAKRDKLLLQAVIAYWKSIALKDDFLYPIRLSYSSYEYDCGRLNENLTRELINLDSVNSNGNDDIRQQRKTQVKRILDLQDKITDLHKDAAKLSVFYRSCIAQPRYQALLSQDSDSVSVELPPSPVEVEKEKPTLQRQPSLKRKKSVHRITVLSPEEFEAHKKGMEVETEVNSEAVPVSIPVVNKMKENRQQEEEEERKKALKEKGEKQRKQEEERRKREEEERMKREEEERRKKEREEKKREEKERRERERKRREEEERKRMEEERKRMEEEEEERKRMVEEELDKMDVEEEDNTGDNRSYGSHVHFANPQDNNDEEEEVEEVEEEDDDELNYFKGDYNPKYQWLQQGNQLLLMLMGVDFDQKSLRCVTKPGKPTPKVIIQGYRIVKDEQPSGYYGLFYASRPTYRYIPFTTVIPLPSIEVDLKKTPTAMYYDDQNVLQIAYTIAQKPVAQHMKKRKQPSPSPSHSHSPSPAPRRQQGRNDRSRYYVDSPFYPGRDCRAPYDPRYEEDEEEPSYYNNRYYRNPYSPYRQRNERRASPFGSSFYPFFGGDMW